MDIYLISFLFYDFLYFLVRKWVFCLLIFKSSVNIIDSLPCTLFSLGLFRHGLVPPFHSSLSFPEPSGPACHCCLLVRGLPLREQACHRLAQLWLLHYGSGAWPQPPPCSAGQVVRVWKEGADTDPKLQWEEGLVQRPGEAGPLCAL